jgi:hypothetical protein
VTADDISEDDSESVQHIVGMLRAIRYRKSAKNREGDSLAERFEEFWFKSVATGAERFFDWVALGLLTDEE